MWASDIRENLSLRHYRRFFNVRCTKIIIFFLDKNILIKERTKNEFINMTVLKNYHKLGQPTICGNLEWDWMDAQGQLINVML